MKIAAYQTDPTLVVGSSAGMNFSIEENGVIFDILRDKMYSNKVGSIVREVASNSRDANRENGNADMPISIIITQQYSEILQDQYCIIFRDSGMGISPNRMADVFVKYAASTKRGTNAQTGGFGLGAKTPFAYTDSFYINTTAINYKGEKRQYFYNALIDDSGTGKMILLSESLTTEPTGTDIILPLVESEDRATFADEVMYYTSLWGKSIILVEVSRYSQKVLDSKDIIVDDESLVIVKTNYYSPYRSGVYCLVDGIPYPIDTRISERITSLKNRLEGYAIFLKFNTGDISVTATREGIEYNEETKKAIDSAFGKLSRLMIKKFSKQVNEMSYLDCVRGVISTFSKQQSLFQKRLFEQTLEGSVSVIFDRYTDEIDILKQIFYKGLSLQSILEKYKSMKSLEIKKDFEVIEVNKSDPEKYKVTQNPNILKISEYPIYLLDSKKDRRRNYTIFDNTDKQKFYLIRPFGKKIEDPLSSSQYDIFSNMVFTFDIEISNYSSVEKKILDPSIVEPGIYVPGETVQTRWRKILHFNYEGLPLVVEVNRKDLSYKEFRGDKYLTFVVPSLSEFSCDCSFINIADEMKYKIYVTSEKTHQLYFKTETVFSLKDQSTLKKRLEKEKVSSLRGSIDMKLLSESLVAKHNFYSLSDRDYFYYRNHDNMTLNSLILLGFYSPTVQTLCKVLLKVEPTIELVKFLFSEREKIEGLNSYQSHYINSLRKLRSRLNSRVNFNVKIGNILEREVNRSPLVRQYIRGNNNNISVDRIDQLVKELSILKTLS